MTDNIKHNAQAILELIESKQFPAARVIFDYVVALVAEFNYDTSKELDQMGKDFFDKADEMRI